MLFGLGFYSYTVGSLSNLLGNSDSRSSQLFRSILIADEFCKDARLSLSMKKKIHTALTYSSYKNLFNGKDRDQFLSDIPVDLKFQVERNIILRENELKLYNILRYQRTCTRVLSQTFPFSPTKRRSSSRTLFLV
jgi:hypothetical protein